MKSAWTSPEWRIDTSALARLAASAEAGAHLAHASAAQPAEPVDQYGEGPVNKGSVGESGPDTSGIFASTVVLNRARVMPSP